MAGRSAEARVYRLFAEAAARKRRQLRRWEAQGFTDCTAYHHLRWSAESAERIAQDAYRLLWRSRAQALKLWCSRGFR